MRELTELIRAVRDVDVAAVSRVLDADPSLVNCPIAAHVAEGHGKMQTLLHLAMPGDGRELTPGHVEVARLLLDHGAEVDALGHGSNQGLSTSLSVAAWGGQRPLVELLLEHGAAPDGATTLAPHDRPVHIAASHGHSGAVDALIQAGAAYDLGDLLMAGLSERVIAYLDEHPDALSGPLTDGLLPLHAALTRREGAPLVSMLLERGADPWMRDSLGRTALHVAIESDRADAVEDLRGSTDALDIFAAAGLGDSATVSKLLKDSPHLALEAQADGVAPLFYAAHSGCTDSARALLDAGADPSPRSDRYWACLTPLHLAVQSRNTGVVRLLLDRGADVDASGPSQASYKPTPLQVAARWGGIEVVRLLLDHGADIYAGSGDRGEGFGNSVLRWVAYANQTDILRLLLERGLDLQHPSARTALHVAAARGHAELVKLLIENGADPSARDDDGLTPREFAVARGRPDVSDLLP